MAVNTYSWSREDLCVCGHMRRHHLPGCTRLMCDCAYFFAAPRGFPVQEWRKEIGLI